MFGKGKKKPETPWAIQFLTTDYLISGIVQPKEYLFGDDDIFVQAHTNEDENDEVMEQLQLETVELEPIGNLTLPRETLTAWTFGLSANLVAVIPNDDPCRQAAQHAFKDYHQPLPVGVYVGPYLVQGQYLSDSSGRGILFPNENSLRPVADAQIDCLLPGSKLKGWRVPWLLLHARQVHGYRRL